MPRLECIEPNCRFKRMLLLRDASILNWEETKRERCSSSELHHFYYEDTTNVRLKVKKKKGILCG